MLLAADRQEGVEAGEMTEALTTVAWGLKQLGRASGGMASVSRARMSSAYGTGTQTDRVRIQEDRSVAYMGLKGSSATSSTMLDETISNSRNRELDISSSTECLVISSIAGTQK